MTIDEFKEKIAPYMESGWIAMNAFGSWHYYWGNKPEIDYCGWINDYDEMPLFMFNIEKSDVWSKSLMEVGK